MKQDMCDRIGEKIAHNKKKNDLFSVSLSIIKVVQMNETSSSGVNIGKVSRVRRGEITFHTTA